jgi:hypothetical protein
MRNNSKDHVNDSDFSKQRKAKARAGLDRQHSISRWMADAVSTQCGKIRRAVSSHESRNIYISPTTATDPQDSTGSSFNNTNANTNTKSRETTKTTPFRLFRRVNSNISLSKPERKRSYGSEGLLKDAFAALSGDSSHSLRSKSRSGSGRVPFFGMDSDPAQELDVDDIDEEDDEHTDDEDDDDDEDDETVEFYSDEFIETDTGTDVDTPTLLTTPITTTATDNSNSTLAPLLTGRLRWDASCPFQQERSSSKVMSVPPPPFSPVLFQGEYNTEPTPKLGQNNINEDDGGVDGISGNSLPSKPPRNHLLENLTRNPNPLAPLAAAASAAIAIVTDIIVDEEDDGLNDLVAIKQQQQQPLPLVSSNSSLQNCESAHDAKTDAATATADSNRSADCWGEDSEISLDGVSMLSASNASLSMSTQWSIASISIGGCNSSITASGTTTGGLGAYMNMVQRKADEDRKKNKTNKNVNTNVNNRLNLEVYMNKVKHKEEEDRKKNRLDYRYKSIAEDSFESAPTFYCDGYDDPSAKKRINLPIKANIDHHVHLLLSTACRGASIVPPPMPMRRASVHKKREDMQTTKTSSRRRSFDNGSGDLGDSVVHIRQTRRATIDNSAATSGSKTPVPPGESPYYCDPNLPLQSRKLKTISLQQSFLTHTMSKTTRTSPSFDANRKRLGGKQPPSSSKPSPVFLRTPIKEEEPSNHSESVVAMIQAPYGTNQLKVDVPLSPVSASR